MKCICCGKPIKKKDTVVYSLFRLRCRAREFVKVARHELCDKDPKNRALIDQKCDEMEKLEKQQKKSHYLQLATFYSANNQPDLAADCLKSAREV